MLSSFLARRRPTSVRPQYSIISKSPLGRSSRRVSGSWQAKRDARDLGNPDLLPGPQRRVQRKAIRLGDDFAAKLVAVVQLGQRHARVARPDRVGDEHHLADLVLECLERRPVRRIEAERGEEPLLRLPEDAAVEQGSALLQQAGDLLRDPTFQALLRILGLPVTGNDRERDRALLQRLPQESALLQLLGALVV